ncbi:MAG: hypothetical protein E6J40_06045 [Chloroflexi bacterium]|nr:MAG: hypothetical protein E6J40_06045 [Chloroflexota bacterium]
MSWSYSCVVPPLTGGITFELDVNPSTQGSIVLVGPRGSDAQSSGTTNVNMGSSALGQYSLTLRFSQSSPTHPPQAERAPTYIGRRARKAPNTEPHLGVCRLESPPKTVI